MQNFTHIFEGVEDPRRGNATGHGLTDMLMIALLSMICGGLDAKEIRRPQANALIPLVGVAFQPARGESRGAI